jgi:hypothetical protein
MLRFTLSSWSQLDHNKKKKVDELPPLDHSEIDYPDFNKVCGRGELCVCVCGGGRGGRGNGSYMNGAGCVNSQQMGGWRKG